MFDTHTHTLYSHDSRADPRASCEAAVLRGLSGVAFTDHADIEYADSQDVIGKCRETFLNLRSVKEEYAGKLTVADGIELGEWIWNYPAVSRILAESDFDVVLASVHAVRYEGFSMPFSGIDFRKMTREQLEAYVYRYFEDYAETVRACDADIFTHLTCPWRYIVGKYGVDLDIAPFLCQIRAILADIVSRGAAFEVNTSCLGGGYGRLMPDVDILRIYKELGGDKITVGSDAHEPELIGHGFDAAADALRSLGFSCAYYFIDRKPIAYKI